MGVLQWNNLRGKLLLRIFENTSHIDVARNVNSSSLATTLRRWYHFVRKIHRRWCRSNRRLIPCALFYKAKTMCDKKIMLIIMIFCSRISILFLMCWHRFFHSFSENMLKNSLHKHSTNLKWQSQFLSVTYYFKNAHTSSIGCKSGWYWGSLMTVFRHYSAYFTCFKSWLVSFYQAQINL